MSPRLTLAFGSPGLIFNGILAIALLSDLWVHPGLPIGSECCGWGYNTWDNYRLLGFAGVNWLLGVCAAALRLMDKPVLCLSMIYAAPLGIFGMGNVFAETP